MKKRRETDTKGDDGRGNGRNGNREQQREETLEEGDDNVKEEHYE